jgi:hypothetical protein
MPWERAQDVWKKFDSTELIEDPTIDQVLAEERARRKQVAKAEAVSA